MREIILDTETTGLDPRQGHRIVEIGCLELHNRFQIGEAWHQYINPEREMPKEAFDVHGISDEFLADKPVFAEIADAFLDFIGEDTIVIHNARFDVSFLNSELERIGRAPITMDRVIDTLELARGAFPAGPNNLDALCKRFRIDNSARTKHGALLDCELLAEVYLELIGGRQARLDLATLPASTSQSQSECGTTEVGPRPKPLPSRLTAEEIAAHQAFIETLGAEAAWKKFL